MKNHLSVLVVFSSILFSACSSNSNTSHRIAPVTPINPLASINSVPTQYQETVRAIKDITSDIGEDFKGTIKIDGKVSNPKEDYKVSELANGLTVVNVEVEGVDQTNHSKLKYESDMYIYQQPYSVVYGNYLVSSNNSEDLPHINKMEYTNVVGLRTENIPTAGKATYNGEAFYSTQTGKLKYDIDFTAQTGHGEITGFDKFGKISLISDQISPDVKLKDDTFGAGIIGEVLFEKGLDNLNGNYQLGLFGPNAEEIAGGMWNINGDVNIIFGGKRDAIKTQP